MLDKVNLDVLLEKINNLGTSIHDQDKSHEIAMQRQTESNDKLSELVSKYITKIEVMDERVKQHTQEIDDIHKNSKGLLKDIDKNNKDLLKKIDTVSVKANNFIVKLLFIITGASVTMAGTVIYEVAIHHI